MEAETGDEARKERRREGKVRLIFRTFAARDGLYVPVEQAPWAAARKPETAVLAGIVLWLRLGRKDLSDW